MGKKLFVGNLNFKTNDDDLRELFSQAGTCESATVMMDRATGRSRGFGFVEMSSDEEALKAIQQFNGYDFQGRNLNVNEARERTPGGPRGGGYGGGGYGGGCGGGYGGGGGRGGYGGGGATAAATAAATTLLPTSAATAAAVAAAATAASAAGSTAATSSPARKAAAAGVCGPRSAASSSPFPGAEAALSRTGGPSIAEPSEAPASEGSRSLLLSTAGPSARPIYPASP